MKVKDFIDDIDVLNTYGLEDNLEIKNVSFNSKNISEGDMFIAICGDKYDGLSFAEEAIKRGAKLIITERDFVLKGVPSLRVKNTRKALGIIANHLYGFPSRNLKVIGITGTNGKTTTAYLINSVLSKGNFCPGLVSTIEYKINERSETADRTTPDALKLNSLFKEMSEESCDSVVMEVSSHALSQERVAYIDFDVAVFTNLSCEHLDYHRTMDNYLEAKKQLFRYLSHSKGEGKFCVINMDDSYSSHFRDVKAGRLFYGFKEESDIKLKEIKSLGKRRSLLILNTPQGELKIDTRLIGEHNVYNILAAVSVGLGMNIAKDKICEGISSLSGVSGRLEFIDTQQAFDVVVDYAHTADALQKVLHTLREISYTKIVVVFGCGGNRDKGKRPLMGEIAAGLADYTILTSDNPRQEDPQDIVEDIKKGFLREGDYEVILDRKEAIYRALSLAQKGYCILVAGKGHESEQEIQNRKLSFNDKQVVEEILSAGLAARN